MPGFVLLKGCTTLEAWRSHPEHRATQRRGYEEFYDSLWVKVCNVVREYEWKRS